MFKKDGGLEFGSNRFVLGLLLSSVLVVSQPAKAQAVAYDLNADGRSDIGWRNLATGANYAYAMEGASVTNSYKINQVATDWYQVGSGDFDNDGTADLLWRNSKTGLNYIYLMNQFGIKQSVKLSQVPLEWTPVAIGDFNHDGTSDVYWHNATTGANYMYLLNNGQIGWQGPLATLPIDWTPIGAGDFNGDGHADIVWRNSKTGVNYLHLMQKGTVQKIQYLSTVSDLNWKIAAIADFDGDGTDDIVWRHGTTGLNYFYKMQNGVLAQGIALNRVADTAWSIVASGDYNGDGQSDLLWRNKTTGLNYMYLMQNFQITSQAVVNKVVGSQWTVMGLPMGAKFDVPPLDLPIYIRGNFFGNVDDWSTRPENLLVYQGNNVYTLEKDLYQGTILQFKAAGANWEGDGSNYNCGGVGELTLNVKAMGECGATSDANFVSIPESGTYRFTVDFSMLPIPFPVFEVALVKAKELHPFGESVSVSDKLYFVSPELTSGLARSRAAFFSYRWLQRVYLTQKVLLNKGVYSFFVQDPSGDRRFGGSQTTLTASPSNSNNMSDIGAKLVTGSNEMITLNVEQTGEYYIGLDLRDDAARLGFFTQEPVFCAGTCSPSDFGDLVTSANEKSIYLRGDLTGEDWPTRQLAQFRKEGTQYFLTVPKLKAGTYTFLFASWDWSFWRCGASQKANIQLVVDGASLQGHCAQSTDDSVFNITTTFTSQNDYTFILDMTDPINPLFKVVTGIISEPGEDIWLRGSMIDSNWAALPEGKLQKLHGDETYYVTLPNVQLGEYQFVFADEDWTEIICGGVDSSSSEIIIGQSLTGVCNLDEHSSLSSKLSSDGTYTFILDYNNPEQPVYQIVEGPLPSALDIYVRGSLIDASWSALPEGKLQRIGLSNRYDLQLDLEAGDNYQFKIASPEWAPINCGAVTTENSTLVVNGDPVLLNCDPSEAGETLILSVPTDGTYLFSVEMLEQNQAQVSVKPIIE